MNIRPATPADTGLVFDFIRQLAVYEREPNAVKMTLPQLHEALFGDPQLAEALIVETESGPQGFALWSQTFSTWTGRPRLYLEDIFVAPEARGLGIGRAIFKHLAALCVARGIQRFTWSVLNWNEPAISFYKSLGAKPETEWTIYGLTQDAITALAAGDP